MTPAIYIGMNPTLKTLLKLALLPVYVVVIWYAYIYIHTRAMFHLSPISTHIHNLYLKYTSYLLPAVVTSLILAVVFAPLFIYLYDRRAVLVALVVTLPTSVFYLKTNAWPREWIFFNIESFLLMILFYLVTKMFIAILQKAGRTPAELN